MKEVYACWTIRDHGLQGLAKRCHPHTLCTLVLQVLFKHALLPELQAPFKVRVKVIR